MRVTRMNLDSPTPRPAACFLISICVAVCLFSGCQEKKTSAPTAPAVEVANVIQKDVPIVREWVGSTDGYVNAKINAQVQGYLIKQNYQEGSLVKKGQILFEIDSRPFQAALEQAKGELAVAEGQLYTAKANLEKIRPLAAINAVSQKDLDDAIGREASARAGVQAAKAAVQRAQIDLSFTRITSPITGIAGISKVGLGELVGKAGGPELTTVSTVNPIKVYVPVSEQEYLRFQRQEESKKSSSEDQNKLELILADGSVFPHKGRVFFADRQVDENTGTIKVATLFPNPGPRKGKIARFFINRPIVAIVIAIVMVIVGVVALLGLPISQYPNIVPPEIFINTTYVGADAQTVEQSVATPIEQEMSGVDNMNYMLLFKRQ